MHGVVVVLGFVGGIALLALCIAGPWRRGHGRADARTLGAGLTAVALLAVSIVAIRTGGDPASVAVSASAAKALAPRADTAPTTPDNPGTIATEPPSSAAPEISAPAVPAGDPVTGPVSAPSSTAAPAVSTERPTTTPPPTVAPTTPPVALAPPTAAAGPKRVLMLGDSLVWQSKPSFEAEFLSRGIDVHLIGGERQCLDWENFVWAQELRQAVATYQPDTVLLESAVFNMYNQNYVSGGSDTPADIARWTSLAEQLTDIAQSGGARVSWILTPIPGPRAVFYGPIFTRVPQANAIYRGIAARRGLTVIDWGQVFSPDGTFHESARYLDGTLVAVHVDDDFHFNIAGQIIMGHVTALAVLG